MWDSPRSPTLPCVPPPAEGDCAAPRCWPWEGRPGARGGSGDTLAAPIPGAPAVRARAGVPQRRLAAGRLRTQVRLPAQRRWPCPRSPPGVPARREGRWGGARVRPARGGARRARRDAPQGAGPAPACSAQAAPQPGRRVRAPRPPAPAAAGPGHVTTEVGAWGRGRGRGSRASGPGATGSRPLDAPPPGAEAAGSVSLVFPSFSFSFSHRSPD